MTLRLVVFALLGTASGMPLSAAGPVRGSWQHQALRRFKAPEAHQGVAVDGEHFYPISNHAIGKYRKDTGERVGGWTGEAGGAIKHLNAGSIIDGRLFCAHSNYPSMPEASSVEIFDVATMRHVGRHAFANPPGSLTWVVRRGGDWFACFAHYRKTSDPALSRVIRFNADWQELASWTFPQELIERFAGNSSSGGAFGPGGHLFVSGHDARELYVLNVPESGGELEWRDTIPISAAGQAFAWDPADPQVLYSIDRKSHEVIVSRMAAREPDQPRGGYESLFDGKSFAGWEHPGNWVIEGDAFYRKDKGGPLTYVVKPLPDDFELRFEWKVSKGCNSGIYYRPGQYEYQVLDNVHSPYGENPRQSAASLFFCMAPAKDASKPFGEWNEGRVVAKGTVIQHWLNGEKVIDFDYTDPKWAKEVELLRIRGADLNARGGRLWLQDHGQPVWFRNIRLRVIPPEESLTASPDFQPMPIPAGALEKENERVKKMQGSVGAAGRLPGPVECEGSYPLHLQGIATDGRSAIFWSWTDALVKTDLKGRLLKQVPAANHHGDLCYHDGKVFVAVNLGKFNEPPGQEDSWVYVYDAETLREVARHPVPELVHGAGGMAHHDGSFIVVGGLPGNVEENYLYEYDKNFRFRKRHVVASGHTDKGIQTATWANGSWWFGCYGTPKILLRTNSDFKMTGRWECDASLGIESLADGRFLVGRNTLVKGKGHLGRACIAREDAASGLVIEKP